MKHMYKRQTYKKLRAYVKQIFIRKNKDWAYYVAHLLPIEFHFAMDFGFFISKLSLVLLLSIHHNRVYPSLFSLAVYLVIYLVRVYVSPAMKFYMVNKKYGLCVTFSRNHHSRTTAIASTAVSLRFIMPTLKTKNRGSSFMIWCVL